MRLFLMGQGVISQRFISLLNSSMLPDIELVGGVLDQVGTHISAAAGQRDGQAVMTLDGRRPNENLILACLRRSEPQVVLSVQYPWILSANFLNTWGAGVLNLHNAKLPDYRGHHCLSHEIANAERVHVSTLHWIEPTVDRGRLVAERQTQILPNDTAHSLWTRSVEACLELLVHVFSRPSELLQEQSYALIPSGGRFYSVTELQRLKRIDTTDPEEMFRIARACWFPPHEPAYVAVGESRLYVLPFGYCYCAPAEGAPEADDLTA